VDLHHPRKIEENGQIIGDDTLRSMLLEHQEIQSLAAHIDSKHPEAEQPEIF
jgi:hypothetical protein